MKKTVLFVLILLSAAVISCTVKLYEPTETEAGIANAKWQGTTLADLQKGKQLYQENCAKCHPLKKAESRNEASWMKILPVMKKKAKISDDTELLIRKYLVAGCSKQ